jgi:hypothetical protein
LRSPTAEILETALALQRAPGERFRLRERPLPDGIVGVLEIASGATQALRDAATELGQDGQDVLEAARFYLEQVLFAAPDADAYRILGLVVDAPQDSIRTHHRWLQRWLHPDRALAGDATVFATRVNQAWSQLRTPELRHAYDVRLAEARLAGASAPLPAATIHRWQQEETEAPAHGRRSRWLLAAALVSCAVLAVLIVRHQETIEPWQQPDHPELAGTDPGPAMDDSDVGILTEALTTPPRRAEPGSAPTPPPLATLPAQAEAEPVPAPRVVPAVVATEPPHPVRAGTVISSATTVAIRPRRAARPGVGAASAAIENPEVVPVPMAIAADAAPAATAAIGATAAEHGAALQGAPDPAVMLERMRQAERRVAQVTAYLAAKPGAAPLWNDTQTEFDAERVRERINARHGAKLELSKTSWRLQHDSAKLSADYRCRTAGGGVGEGRLDVQLVWREGLWLVRSVDLAPAA